MSSRPHTPLLDQIQSPDDLKRFDDAALCQIAEELRQETISAVSETGGHLGAGLGVVELTVALHAIFDTPKDKLIWDVSHQAYPHKILTGRARSHSHAAPKARLERFHEAQRISLRSLWRGSFEYIDQRGPRLFGRP